MPRSGVCHALTSATSRAMRLWIRNEPSLWSGTLRGRRQSRRHRTWAGEPNLRGEPDEAAPCSSSSAPCRSWPPAPDQPQPVDGGGEARRTGGAPRSPARARPPLLLAPGRGRGRSPEARPHRRLRQAPAHRPRQPAAHQPHRRRPGYPGHPRPHRPARDSRQWYWQRSGQRSGGPLHPRRRGRVSGPAAGDRDPARHPVGPRGLLHQPGRRGSPVAQPRADHGGTAAVPPHPVPGHPGAHLGAGPGHAGRAA